MMDLFNLHFIIRVLVHHFCQYLIDMEKYIYAYAKVGAIHKCFVTALVTLLYFA